MSCTDLEVTGDNLPDVENLTIQSLNSPHDIVHVEANAEQYAYMYEKFRSDTIIPASISYYTPDGVAVFSDLPSNLEIKGAASAGNLMKSLGMTFEQDIPNSQLGILNPIYVLPQHNLQSLKTFRLRNSGNDFGFTMLKDMTYTELAIQAGLNVELMYGKPVHAFVNNDYFGLLNLRTESNANGISRLIQAQTNEITLLKVDVDNAKLEYREGDEIWANELIDAIKTEDAEKLWELINVDSFIDYIIYQDYVGNRDWPVNNMRVYSHNREKFRFILYDLDYSAFNTKKPLIPAFEYLDHHMAIMYNGLREHPSFDDKFNARQKELYKKLTPDRFNVILDEFAERIENDIPYLISKYQSPPSTFHWRMKVSELERDFERRDKHIRDKYNL
jgi:hypothetical protein